MEEEKKVFGRTQRLAIAVAGPLFAAAWLPQITVLGFALSRGDTDMQSTMIASIVDLAGSLGIWIVGFVVGGGVAIKGLRAVADAMSSAAATKKPDAQ